MSRGAAAPICGVTGNQPYSGGRHAHQGDGDQEGVFPAELVAEIAEQDRAQRPEGEAHREGRPGEQRREQFVAGREEAALQDARGVSVPQMKKSYHSKTVPTDEAAITIRVLASSSLRSSLACHSTLLRFGLSRLRAPQDRQSSAAAARSQSRPSKASAVIFSPDTSSSAFKFTLHASGCERGW